MFRASAISRLFIPTALIARLVSTAHASPMTDADKLYDAGDLKGAESAYRLVLRAEPDNVFALEGLQSAIRFQPGRGSADVADVSAKLQSVSAKPYAHGDSDKTADVYFRSHDYKAAEPLYREALAADAKDDYAWARLIDCLDGQGMAAESAQAMKERAAGKGAGGSASDASYTPTPMPTPAAATPAGSPVGSPVAPAGMDRWFAKTDISRGGNLVATFYNIADGNVYQGLPNGAKSFAELQKIDPAHCGKATANGSELTFAFPDKQPEHHTVGNGTIDNAPLQKVLPLQAGVKFAGRYAIANSASAGGVDSYGADIWTFKADGTCEHEGTGSVSTTPHHAGTGDHPAQSNGASAHALRGNYSFDNGVMTFGGDGNAYSAWNIGDKSPPWYLLIDGRVYTGQ